MASATLLLQRRSSAHRNDDWWIETGNARWMSAVVDGLSWANWLLPLVSGKRDLADMIEGHWAHLCFHVQSCGLLIEQLCFLLEQQGPVDPRRSIHRFLLNLCMENWPEEMQDSCFWMVPNTFQRNITIIIRQQLTWWIGKCAHFTKWPKWSGTV